MKGDTVDLLNVLGRDPAMYIDGSWVTAEETRPAINPSDESTIAAVPEANVGHAEQALEAAR
jgi:acyl-CoA reductase-like NAD-dependent aldehyde dehydrogenase